MKLGPRDNNEMITDIAAKHKDILKARWRI